MVRYFLYKLGQFVALFFPLKMGYFIATQLAILQYHLSYKDRRAVINNLKVILGQNQKERQIEAHAKRVFINFGKYLVDFFRFSKLDKKFVEKFVEVEGLNYINNALKQGKGVIAVTAHIGNWELAGVVTSMLGCPVNAIAMSHRHKRVNELFVRQRTIKGVKVIPLGAAVRKCLECLNNNELVALLGDRDFTTRGIPMKFLGKEVIVPKGPATLSLKADSPIIPGFMIRKGDKASFKFTFEKPIEYKPTGRTEFDMKKITKAMVSVIEDYIRRYPDQWFMFREFWSQEARKMI